MDERDGLIRSIEICLLSSEEANSRWHQHGAVDRLAEACFLAGVRLRAVSSRRWACSICGAKTRPRIRRRGLLLQPELTGDGHPSTRITQLFHCFKLQSGNLGHKRIGGLTRRKRPKGSKEETKWDTLALPQKISIEASEGKRNDDQAPPRCEAKTNEP